MQARTLLKSFLFLTLLFFSNLIGYSFNRSSAKLFYIAEDAHKFSCEDIRRLHRENKLKEDSLNFNIAYKARTAWFALNLESDYESRILVLENAHLDSIALFYFAGDQLLGEKESGDHRDFSTRDFKNNFFSFKIPQGTTHIFIRARTEGPMILPVKIFSEVQYFNYWSQVSIFHWIYFALIFFSVLTNFLIYLWLKERFYIYYLLCLISIGLITAVDFGYTFQYIWPHYPKMNELNHLFFYLAIFPLLFLEKILNIKKDAPALHKTFQLIYLFTICTVVVSWFLPYWFSVKIVYAYYIVTNLFSLFSTVYVYKKFKQEYSQFILVGMILYFGASFTYMMAIGAGIEYNTFTNNLIQIGSGIQIICINIATLSKLKILKQENERLLIEQNKVLEKRVEERTLELNQKNEEISSQKQAIEEKNKILKNQQGNLEKLIGERTEELKLMNTELVDKNNRLEQFAFVTAHNLRGPVATILGLCQIINKQSIVDPENLTVLNNVEDITKKLDGIIKDLTTLLDLEKNIQSINESVALRDTLEEVKVLLHNEIKESGAVITDNFVGVETISTVPSYINNIFYNLISNSIKFRRYNSTPEIKILRESGNDFYSIAFHDNGAGIDMKKYGPTVGNPYKRFHPDVKGKGLGLYITRKQIEAMNGRMEINSSPNKGTSIKVILKMEKVEL